ncbi:hypothetical protein TNIN_361931 [Trichonephila inaurata madagascariensis]|uniref:Uncharacterized protein n=1 Tax=Trichonephila inaurata madagascariensis TaxID=2747483 RepID=A0A8X7C379_9ARAC|nr:hypothetical protein TNIN_361931 [Trichonephila inaurata madagascariensis]
MLLLVEVTSVSRKEEKKTQQSKTEEGLRALGTLHLGKYPKSKPFTLLGANPIPPRIYSSEPKVGRLGQLRESMPSQDLPGSIPSIFRTIWRPISPLQEPPLLPFIQNKFLSEEFAQQMSWLG